MLTQVATGNLPLRATSVTQKVVIVNGNAEILELLDSVLDAGHYDVVFVESSQHAYSQIKRVRPDLVIVCVHIDDGDGLQVLSMLKIDGETRNIPVLTYTTEVRASDPDEDVPDTMEGEMLASKPAALMN